MNLVSTQPLTPPSPSSSPSHDSTMSSPPKRSASSIISARRGIPDNFKAMTVPPLPDDIELPSLPTIGNKVLEQLVFTHSSVAGQARTRVNFNEGDGELLDNEKLEWVGDGILKAVCTRLLHRLWPNMREGPTTTIMSHLVSNSTLAQISQRYSLMQRVRVSPSARMAVQSSEKNQANLFESYIAGYFQSIVDVGTRNDAGEYEPNTEGHAYDKVSAWLVPVFTPIAHFIREYLHAEQQRNSRTGPDEDGDDFIDPAVVVGSSSRLNEYFIGVVRTGLPLYLHSPTEGLLWKTSCTVTLRDGRKMSTETVQTGKKPGMQAAAYKLLVKLGLEKKLS